MPSQRSVVPVSSRRPVSSVVVAAMLALVLLLSACGTQRTPDHYTSGMRRDFLAACEGKNPDQKGRLAAPANVCACAYDKIVKEIKFSRFKKVNQDLSDKPGPLPADIASRVQSCAGGSPPA